MYLHIFPSLWLVFLILFLAEQKVFNFLNEASLFSFMDCVFGVVAKNSSVYSLCHSVGFIVLHFTLRFRIRFD